jgi:hypothetical protein
MRAAVAGVLRHAPWPALVAACLLFAAWQLSAGGGPRDELPTPAGVLHAGAAMIVDGTLPRALLVSWQTVMGGFCWAMALGVPLGIAAGTWGRFGAWILPVLNLLRPIAPFAWIPMAILWFGVRGGAAIIDHRLRRVLPDRDQNAGRRRARAHLADRRRAHPRRVAMDDLPPHRRAGDPAMLFVGLRLGVGLAWAAVIAAELATGRSTNAPPRHRIPHVSQLRDRIRRERDRRHDGGDRPVRARGRQRHTLAAAVVRPLAGGTVSFDREPLHREQGPPCSRATWSSSSPTSTTRNISAVPGNPTVRTAASRPSRRRRDAFRKRDDALADLRSGARQPGDRPLRAPHPRLGQRLPL